MILAVTSIFAIYFLSNLQAHTSEDDSYVRHFLRSKKNSQPDSGIPRTFFQHQFKQQVNIKPKKYTDKKPKKLEKQKTVTPMLYKPKKQNAVFKRLKTKPISKWISIPELLELKSQSEKDHEHLSDGSHLNHFMKAMSTIKKRLKIPFCNGLARFHNCDFHRL